MKPFKSIQAFIILSLLLSYGMAQKPVLDYQEYFSKQEPREFTTKDKRTLGGVFERNKQTYKGGNELEWVSIDGEMALRRNFSSRGNQGDFFAMRTPLPPGEAYTAEIKYYVPEGFFALTRAGKIPIELGGGEKVALRNNPIPFPGFVAISMFWTDKNESGGSLRQSEWRKRGMYGTYIYAESEGQKKNFGKPFPAKQLIKEGVWNTIRIIVSTSGIYEMYLNGDLVLSYSDLVWTSDKSIKVDRFTMPWFLGGADKSYDPLKPTFAMVKNIKVWEGIVRPNQSLPVSGPVVDDVPAPGESVELLQKLLETERENENLRAENSSLKTRLDSALSVATSEKKRSDELQAKLDELKTIITLLVQKIN